MACESVGCNSELTVGACGETLILRLLPQAGEGTRPSAFPGPSPASGRGEGEGRTAAAISQSDVWSYFPDSFFRNATMSARSSGVVTRKVMRVPGITVDGFVSQRSSVASSQTTVEFFTAGE
jgi:hypothetical protein